MKKKYLLFLIILLNINSFSNEGNIKHKTYTIGISNEKIPEKIEVIVDLESSDLLELPEEIKKQELLFKKTQYTRLEELKLQNRGIRSNVMMVDLKKAKKIDNYIYCEGLNLDCYKESSAFWDINDTFYIFNEDNAVSIKKINLKDQRSQNMRLFLYKKNKFNLYKKIDYSEKISFEDGFKNINFETKTVKYMGLLTPYHYVNNDYNKLNPNKWLGSYKDNNGNTVFFGNINRLNLFNCDIEFKNESKSKFNKEIKNGIQTTPQIISLNNKENNECAELIKNNKISKLLIYKKGDNKIIVIYETNKILFISEFKKQEV